MKKLLITCTALALLGSSASIADSRLAKKRQEKEQEPTFIKHELTVKKKISLPFKPKNTQNRCEANISLSYSQANTAVRVKTDISVADTANECPDARGEYRVRVRSMSSNGEPRTQEFNEPWQLGTGRSVTQAHDYDLKSDPDLLWVRINATPKTRCVCEPSDPVANDPTKESQDLSELTF